ncbi:MAG: FHA domain-containing protein [Rhodospirillaceae bacterium]
MTEASRRSDVYIVVRDRSGRTLVSMLPADKDSYLIGRTEPDGPYTPELALDDSFVSRRHCEIFRTEPSGKWFLRDLSSSNGTFVDGTRVRVAQPVVLSHDSHIELGSTLLVVGIGMPATRTEEIHTNRAAIIATTRLAAEKAPAAGCPSLLIQAESVGAGTTTTERLTLSDGEQILVTMLKGRLITSRIDSAQSGEDHAAVRTRSKIE